MRIIKYIIGIIVILMAVYATGWYYIAHSIAKNVNQYANKPFLLEIADRYYLSFNKVEVVGFPNSLFLKVTGWKEETPYVETTYNDPIYIGYDLFKQQLSVHYDGKMRSLLKPVQDKHGLSYDIKNYSINIDFPLSQKLIYIIQNMHTSFELINNIHNIWISSDNVKIYNIQHNQLITHKKYEKIQLDFTADQYYYNIDDITNNIPKKYILDYQVKDIPINNRDNKNIIEHYSKSPYGKKLFTSLLYGFSLFPSAFTGNINVAIEN